MTPFPLQLGDLTQRPHQQGGQSPCPTSRVSVLLVVVRGTRKTSPSTQRVGQMITEARVSQRVAC